MTTLTTHCRVLIDPDPNSGSWNMAVDEALLESALKDGLCTVRIYEWAEPTISLGYFQRFQDHLNDSDTAELPAVRRLTGGGAILHHRELTYSCFVPPSHRLAIEPHRLYDEVHAAILCLLSDFGIDTRLRAKPDSTKDTRFLCFGRGDARDIVLGPHKILGSAQRRRRGSVLQHGSLLLQASPHASHFPGLLDLALGQADPNQLPRVLSACIAAVLAEDHSLCSSLSKMELARAWQLRQTRYVSAVWNEKS